MTQYWGGQNIAWFSNSMEGNLEKGCGKWVINANNEPESVGLKPSFGRLISHCRKHPNLRNYSADN